MNNEYFPDVPFHIEGVGDVWLRLKPRAVATHGDFRAERFNNTVNEGDAVFTLEAQRVNSSITREWLGIDVGELVTTFSLGAATKSNPWIPLVEVKLGKRVDIDQGRLKFDPASRGRGLEPRGIVTAIRRPVYELDQAVRPQTEKPVTLVDRKPSDLSPSSSEERPARTIGLDGVLKERMARSVERTEAAER